MKHILIANWKMNGLKGDIHNFCTQPFPVDISENIQNKTLILCPPSIYLGLACAHAPENLLIYAQDCSAYEKGAYTGEISVAMLADMGVKGVLLGHSERRIYHGETDARVGKKLAAALTCGLTPVVCIGETREDYESKQTQVFVEAQIAATLDSCDYVSTLHNIVWAYEPRWAIGTGKTPTQEEITTVIQTIRETLEGKTGNPTPHIIYGGSVTAQNAHAISTVPSVHGALIGGASLDKDCLAEIIRQWGSF
ncbi:MAG: triose-phosphate isomerase [Alphaproteobacteria bacterium]|nr:MAG: triose-phosphate isomerase [Alphaproteobacteria bacterium]